MLFLVVCLIALAYSMVVLPMLPSFGKSWKSLGNPCLISYQLVSLADVQGNELTMSTLDFGNNPHLQIDLAEKR